MPFALGLVLVVIIITPSFARAPYKAEAAAPFKMLMLSMSSGLMLCNPSPPSDVFPPPPPPSLLLYEPSLLEPARTGFVQKFVLSIRPPLMTMSGLFCPEIDD